MGLRNIDRVVPMLIPATTSLGQTYYQLSEVYDALLVKRQKELSSVAKIVGGVEETRYHAGRGTAPFMPVPAERQRKAVKFLLERGFTRPNALLDPQVVWRMAPYGATDALQDTNQKLLSQLVDEDVFHRMADAASFPGAVGSYQGIDLLLDLNDGLFVELKAPRPAIDGPREDDDKMQRFRFQWNSPVAISKQPYARALKTWGPGWTRRRRRRDPQTRAHLKDLKAAIDRGS
jgi:hypothetical protein